MISGTNKLILAFVTLILGAVLIGTISSEGNDKTTVTIVGPENISIASGVLTGRNFNATVTYTIANPPTSWKVDDCPITNFQLYNTSGIQATESTNYAFTASTGKFNVVNNSATQLLFNGTNITTAYYNYCSDDYLNSSWGRNMVNLVSGFFALVILGISVGLFWSVAKENGILNW